MKSITQRHKKYQWLFPIVSFVFFIISLFFALSGCTYIREDNTIIGDGNTNTEAQTDTSTTKPKITADADIPIEG